MIKFLGVIILLTSLAGLNVCAQNSPPQEKAIDSEFAQPYWIGGKQSLSQEENELFSFLKTKAEKGDANAQFALSNFYLNKMPDEFSDYDIIYKMLEKAARQGHLEAQFHLGYRYAYSLGAGSGNEPRAPSVKKSIYWLEKAAKRGHANAQYYLGLCYFGKYGWHNRVKVAEWPKDAKKALYWLEKAGMQGHPKAFHQLGISYKWGSMHVSGRKLIPQDAKKSVRYFEQAAKLGCLESMIELGDHHLKEAKYIDILNNKDAILRHNNTAISWYKKASARNIPEAQFKLGKLYFDDYSVPDETRFERLKTAIKLYKVSAEHGFADAQFALGDLFLRGLRDHDGNIILAKNEHECIRWIRKAAEQNHAEAQSRLGVYHGRGNIGGLSGDHQESIKWHLKAVENGSSYSAYQLGLKYDLGIGVEKNYNKAYLWYVRAKKIGGKSFISSRSRQLYFKVLKELKGKTDKVTDWMKFCAPHGDPLIQNSLAWRYFSGKEIPENKEKAFSWFKIAAENGHASSQHMTAICYHDGLGVKKNYKQAFKWQKQAVETILSNEDEVLPSTREEYILELAKMYYWGKGTEKNEKKAFDSMMPLAEKGNSEAQAFVGGMYLEGRGVERNKQMAFKWYKKSAIQGNARAQYNIGFMYANGEGAAKNLKEAFHWYRQAARQDVSRAQYVVGVMYFTGEGVLKDPRHAKEWIKKADLNGHKEAAKFWKKHNLWQYPDPPRIQGEAF